MSKKELVLIREYININIKKKFIRLSELLVGYPVIFVPKKNRKLRLCVDYQKLNDITIKNRYLLLNITEL
jgi:DNA mismatch repair protein MutH